MRLKGLHEHSKPGQHLKLEFLTILQASLLYPVLNCEGGQGRKQTDEGEEVSLRASAISVELGPGSLLRVKAQASRSIWV